MLCSVLSAYDCAMQALVWFHVVQFRAIWFGAVRFGRSYATILWPHLSTKFKGKMLSGIKLNMAYAYGAPVHCIIQSLMYGMVKYFSRLRNKW